MQVGRLATRRASNTVCPTPMVGWEADGEVADRRTAEGILEVVTEGEVEGKSAAGGVQAREAAAAWPQGAIDAIVDEYADQERDCGAKHSRVGGNPVRFNSTVRREV